MAITEELLIKLTADNTDLKAKMADSEKSVGILGKAVGAIGPMIAGAFAIGSIGSFAAAAFKSAEQQMQVNKRLLFSLKGNTLAFKELANQAENIRAATGVDDAAIMQIQTLGGAAGYSTDKIKKITQASVELAAVTGQDLQAAYMQVNATFNGSAGKLTRLDAEFDTLSESQLRNGGAVDLLIKKYDGFAANSATETQKFSSNWDEFTERLGKVTLPTINKVFGQINKDMEVNSATSLTFLERWTKSQKDLLALIKERKAVEDKADSDRLAAIVKGQEGFLKTAAGIKMVADKTAELRKNSKFLNSEVEPVNKSTGSNAKKEAQLKEFNDLFAEVQAEHDAILIEKKKSLADQLSEDSKYFDNLFADAQKSDDDILRLKKEAEKKLAEDTKNAQKDYDLSKLSSYEKEKALIEASLVDAKSKAELMTQLEIDTNNAKAESMANMFGQAAAMFKENTIAYKAMATAQIMISTYIAAMAAFADGSKYGGPILGAVYAAIAVAAGLATIAKVNGIAFADGGIVSGPTNALIGEYAGARSNPEVVAPLDKLKGMLGGGRQQVEVVGYISGDVIRLANKRSEYILNRRG